MTSEVMDRRRVGAGWLVVQALALGVLAELEWLALQRLMRSAFA